MTLFDAFICHASEDKDVLVRPLADALRAQHVEVWYDEFELRVGDSIRRAIDQGLAQSRFGIVVLSPSFFAKNWPQYELDGLLDRELAGSTKVILPVWHDVDHGLVSQYSLPLANRHAAQSRDGLDAVVDAIVRVIRPHGSPLIIAREQLIAWGIDPPVVTDPYWLDVVEASNRIPAYGAEIPPSSHWGRWSFPLPPREDSNADAWGERLAWTAMQMRWCSSAEGAPISVVTRPQVVLDFVESHPGLVETCKDYPSLAAEYAPQLTIRGFGGPLEDIFEEMYLESLEKRTGDRNAGSSYGTALTTDRNVPRCDVEWALRDSELGGYQPVYLAENYFHADGMFGPPVSFHEDALHVFWLLSVASSWLPSQIRTALREGLAETQRRWVWGEYFDTTRRGVWETWGALGEELFEAYETGHFSWTEDIERDVLGMATLARQEFQLPESADVLLEEFRASPFVRRNVEIGTKRAQGVSHRRVRRR